MLTATPTLSTHNATPAAAAGSPDRRRAINPDTLIDEALVRRYIAGEEVAFVEIMERYHSKILAITMSLMRNRGDAEELTQDTFIRAHRGLANFRGESSLSTWLYRIAVNLSRNRYWYFFRRHRQDSLSLDCPLGGSSQATFSDLVSDGREDPSQVAAAREIDGLAQRCMKGLDTAHREVLELRNVMNRSYADIATALNINVGTVKSRIARARDNLRILICEACPEFAGASPAEWFLPPHSTYSRPTIASD
jgi:RNA polymerase sigma-70 factor (ECF subfamily)